MSEEWKAWHWDIPADDPTWVLIDMGSGYNARAELLEKRLINFVQMVSLHPQTINDTLKLMQRGPCREVWIRLRAAPDIKATRQRRRIRAVSTLLMRLTQISCLVVMDSQAQNDAWETLEIRGVVNASVPNFQNTLHR